jgi:hypothetical protein
MFEPQVPAEIYGLKAMYGCQRSDMRRISVTPKENQYGLRIDLGDDLERSTSVYI